MLASLYFKLGTIGVAITLLGGFYYQYHYKPINELKSEKKKIAKSLREEYIKNSALELELVVCIDDKELSSFESEMKGAGDEIEDDNITTDNKLIF